jgi:hypothetical protein
MAKQKPDYRKYNGGKREGAGRPNPYSCKVVCKQVSIPIDGAADLAEAVKAIRQKYLKNQEDFSEGS